MIDKEVIREKFQELNRYLKELDDLKGMSWNEFSSSLPENAVKPLALAMGI
ncbi:MAG: hypothetical protein ABIH40_01310 [Candidatus Omnitrophota bacterium]